MQGASMMPLLHLNTLIQVLEPIYLMYPIHLMYPPPVGGSLLAKT
jgi:hypothetical protein